MLSHLDHCSYLLLGVPGSSLAPLWCISSKAARMFKSSQWLPTKLGGVMRTWRPYDLRSHLMLSSLHLLSPSCTSLFALPPETWKIPTLEWCSSYSCANPRFISFKSWLRCHQWGTLYKITSVLFTIHLHSFPFLHECITFKSYWLFFSLFHQNTNRLRKEILERCLACTRYSINIHKWINTCRQYAKPSANCWEDKQNSPSLLSPA